MATGNSDSDTIIAHTSIASETRTTIRKDGGDISGIATRTKKRVGTEGNDGVVHQPGRRRRQKMLPRKA
jgi:hypothetical protein